MFAAVGVITFGAIIFFWEGRMLLKQKRKKEMIVFTLSLLAAVTLYSGVVLRLPIPTLAEAIGTVLRPVVKPIIRWIEGGAA